MKFKCSKILIGSLYVALATFSLAVLLNYISNSSSFTPNVVDAAVDIDGEWVSSSNGIDGVSNIVGIATDPTNWSTLYIYTSQSGVYKSTDGGSSWTRRSAGLPANPRAHMSQITVLSNLIEIDPNDGNKLYLNVTGEIYRTTDGANSWSEMSDGTKVDCSPLGGGTASNVVSVLVDRTNSNHLWAGTVASGCNGGIFEIPNVAQSQVWNWISGDPNVNDGMNNDGWEILQSPANPSILYSSSVHTTARRSTDGGRNWTSITPPGLDDVTIILRPHPTDVNYLLLSAGGDLFRSTDQGATWSSVTNSPKNIIDVQFAPSDGNRVYMTAGGKFYRSNDKGVTWTATGNLSQPKPFKAILVHPTDKNKLYITSGGSGLFSTQDGGGTITSLNNQGLPSQIDSRSFSIDPQNSSIYYVFVSGQGIFKSTDKGSNWSLYSADFEVSNSWKHILHPTDPNRVYAGGTILARSDDHGISWTDISPISGEGFRGFDIHPTNKNIVLAPTWTDNKIFKTTDGGNTWSVLTTQIEKPTEVSFHPTNPNIIIVASFKGLFRSTDGGVTWTNIYLQNDNIFGGGTAAERFDKVKFNPYHPDQVFVANRLLKGYVSMDAGVTWKVALDNATASVGRPEYSVHDANGFYAADAYSAFSVIKNGNDYISTKLPTTGIRSGEYFANIFGGILEDPDNPSRILALTTGNIYVYDTSDGAGGGGGGGGLGGDLPTISEIIGSYGTRDVNKDVNNDGVINGFDFAIVAGSN